MRTSSSCWTWISTLADAALTALSEALGGLDAPYPHRFAAPPNTGQPTGVDLDGDGRSYRARDAHGYGLFSGDGGMAILSRVPIGAVRDFSGLPWMALPENVAEPSHRPRRSRRSACTVAAWDVELLTPAGPLHILASHASPPVFDGPEDRNGLRNAMSCGSGRSTSTAGRPEGPPFAAERFVVMGTFNIDPNRGEGRREGLRALLDHALLQDPEPVRGMGETATADWAEDGPGRLRVDYILPSRTLSVTGSGILWPGETSVLGVTGETVAAASDHRLIWVDLAF
jgi:hypothetical protein